MNIKALPLLVVLFCAIPVACATDGTELFATSDRCMACHNGLTAPSGQDVSFGTDWRSSLMAHSARDPYWQGSVRREVMLQPSAAEAIEHECAACHMPMSRYIAKIHENHGDVFTHLPVVQAQSPRGLLAVDGVSCTMCHQIEEDRLGTEESFTAGFVVDEEVPPAERRAYGPYEVDAGRQRLMRSATRFLPSESSHVQSSQLCATCHTLYTHALNDQGEVVGELPEQVPYLEWQHSAYYEMQSCQSCHMPEVDGEMLISSVMGKPREEVSRHVFRGGNFFMPKILNAHRAELGVVASPQELETTSRQTAEHLQESAAEIELKNVAVENGRLVAEVALTNLAGHKVPTAYPSRRAWLHFVVKDGRGRTVFESGELRPDGSIAGNDNDEHPDRFEPHYTEITSEEQVQVYEPILGTPDGHVTTVLLGATHYLKDNRLLPIGFDKASAGEDIAVQGAARDDADFDDGGDRVRYSVPLPEDAGGPFTIEAALWYQPIGFRWAHNLSQQPADETTRFVAYYEQFANQSGIVLAEVTARAE
jgi:hypothetical protein